MRGKLEIPTHLRHQPCDYCVVVGCSEPCEAFNRYVGTSCHQERKRLLEAFIETDERSTQNVYNT